MGRLLLYCLGQWRQILRAIQRDPDANSNCNNNGYAYIYSKAYSHAEASPDPGSTPLVRQSELGQGSSNKSMSDWLR